jgi:hypothetical protein
MLRILLSLFPLILAAVGALAWWISSVEHEAMLGHMNAIAPDGEVRSYSFATHDRLQANLRAASIVLVVLGLLLFLLRERVWKWLCGPPGTPSFGEEMRREWRTLRRHTSKGHHQLVVLLLVIAALLRGWALFLPITYDEAFTYVYYASRPLHVLLSDYSYPNNHVFHSLLVKLSTGVFGINKVALRLPAFVAGMLALPVFYLFVRRMFNRHIALLTLVLLVPYGRFIEYGALARGYAITWLCFVCALLLGRRMVKEDDRTCAVLIALCCAIGLWAVPTMIYPTAMVYIWLLLYIASRYNDSRARRMVTWVVSGLALVLLTGLLYMPLLVVNGLDRLLHHEVLGPAGLEHFLATYEESILSFWAWSTDVLFPFGGVAVIVALVVAGYVSAKYRRAGFAMALGAVPLVVIQMDVAPPRAWAYAWFIFLLGGAIALYYLFKAVHDRGVTWLNDRRRVVVAAIVLLPAMAIPALRELSQDPGRSHQAADCARSLVELLGPGDRILVQYPWEAPVEFEAMSRGMDRAHFHVGPGPGGRTWAVVGVGQSLADVLALHEVNVPVGAFDLVQDRDGMKIFAARTGSAPPVGTADNTR